MEIRKATEQDVEGISRVCAAGWRDTYPSLISQETIENIIRAYYHPDRVRKEVRGERGRNGWWVAVEEGCVVGAGEGCVVGAGEGGLVDRGVGELFVLYVDPQRRGQGIGTRLLEAVIEDLKSQGARDLWLSVAEGNMKGIPFYEARGFIQRERRKTYGLAREENLISLRYWRPI